MKKIYQLAALLPLMAHTADVMAADFSDPTWPCIQRKVPNMSMGQMWAGPIPDENARIPRDVDELASALAVRRTALEDAEKLIADFAMDQDDAKNDQLSLLFMATFQRIDQERSALISGIARYAGKQTDLSEYVDRLQQEVAALAAKEDKSFEEFDKMEELEDQLTWEARIFKERAQSLTFVCETPVLLEKRAFSIARAIMNHLD